ncbi:MAG TPA: Gfo/Idh/MocA family oxidoreductase [Candidatus Brocadiia bacterium]|nr:Gfo/Idh/MocA family oxidoreductase [Candidatus Brocadiia bacterium]
MKREGMKPAGMTRRDLLRRAFAGGAAIAMPTIVPASVFGANAPSNRITMGCIGVGRMGMGDMRSFLGFKEIRIVSVCDVDSNRAKTAQGVVDLAYAMSKGSGKGCDATGDFREITSRTDIDSVMICTPDHWHVIPAIAAAKSGKDIFLQKPMSLTIAEGRALSDTCRRYGVVLQVGSQQRSDSRAHRACELVRNGRIGKVHTVRVATGADPATGLRPTMPVPENLDYDMWLGPAARQPYTEDRVHPQKGYGRPGWLRITDYGAGMVTGWGAHHLDITQWGLGVERTGPVEIEGEAVFPTDGLWDVHGPFKIEYTYANGVKVIYTDPGRARGGVTFEGTEGWIWYDRDRVEANPKSVLDSVIKPDEIHLCRSLDHKGNFIESIRTREEPVAPVEVGHRSCSTCLLGQIAMSVGRKLKWNPEQERFIGDEEADRWISRPMRSPWSL